jgi:hypothetical protein
MLPLDIPNFCYFGNSSLIPNESISKSFRTQSIAKNMLNFGTAHREAAQRVMAAKLTRLTHKMAIQLH